MTVRMKLGLLLAAILLPAAAAQTRWDWGDPDPQWAASGDYAETKALCRTLRDREPPLADRPDARTARSLAGCDSEALYYGIGMPSDPVRARQCAFLEKDGEPAEIFGGRTILMTAYANGRGARRDLDVAIHLACGIDGAPAESHGRVLHLAELRDKGPAAGGEFHYCDDITSGLGMGQCAAHDARIERARRDGAIARLMRGWTAGERAAFARLQSAHDGFAEARGSGEVDLSGTARGAFLIDAEEAARDELLVLLEARAAGRYPKASEAAYRAADERLNAAYRRRLAALGRSGPVGTVNREGVRDAQRAWLRYRDAFLDFAAVKWPAASRDGLAARLTDRRTAMLRDEAD